jgi:predicted O-methyltransferase YrrM
MPEALHSYLLSVSLREHPVLAQLRQETAGHPHARMQILPDEGQLLAWLVTLIGAKKTLDIGVFTGYSSLVVALALPDDGKVVACDTSPEFTAVARCYWQQAGVQHKVDLRLAPASETLAALIAQGETESYDFAFIDADKTGYDQYYEQCLELLRPGGIVAVDNVLQHGRVVDETQQDDSVRAVRAFNQKVHGDERVSVSMLSVADGLTLALKRPR